MVEIICIAGFVLLSLLNVAVHFATRKEPEVDPNTLPPLPPKNGDREPVERAYRTMVHYNLTGLPRDQYEKLFAKFHRAYVEQNNYVW